MAKEENLLVLVAAKSNMLQKNQYYQIITAFTQKFKKARFKPRPEFRVLDKTSIVLTATKLNNTYKTDCVI